MWDVQRQMELMQSMGNPLLVFSLVGVALLFGCDCRHKVAPFESGKARVVVLYDFDPRESPNYSVVPTNVISQTLKPEEVKLLFANTKKESLHVWKGAMLGVVQCEGGAEYHLAISSFGGFARVLETGQGIRFVGVSGVEYERIKDAVLTDVFIPERQRKNRANGR